MGAQTMVHILNIHHESKRACMIDADVVPELRDGDGDGSTECQPAGVGQIEQSLVHCDFEIDFS